MKVLLPAILSALTGAAFSCGCCQVPDDSAVCKGVKSYERYSDDLGKERGVRVLGKDVDVEPQATDKIRIRF